MEIPFQLIIAQCWQPNQCNKETERRKTQNEWIRSNWPWQRHTTTPRSGQLQLVQCRLLWHPARGNAV